MRISEILNGIERNRGFYPRKEIEAAIQSKDEIIPELLNILKNLNQNYQELYEDESYFAHIFAMYLLAQFRVEQAYPLICEFFSIPGEFTLDMTGDFVTEDLGKVLASVAKGDDSLIKKLIEDDNVNEFVRSAALNSLVIMVAEGEKTREEVIEYFSELFQYRLERKMDYIFSALVCSSMDLFPEELLDDIKKAFDDGLIETFTVTFKNVEETIKQGKEKILGRLTDQESVFRLVSDTIKATEWWHCFHAEETPKISTGPQVVNYGEFVGRNDPCPCKSGKKYKKCCGRN